MIREKMEKDGNSETGFNEGPVATLRSLLGRCSTASCNLSHYVRELLNFLKFSHKDTSSFILCYSALYYSLSQCNEKFRFIGTSKNANQNCKQIYGASSHGDI